MIQSLIMNKSFRYLYAALFAAMIMNACNPAKEETKKDELAPPIAEKKPDTLTGNRIDNYYWMKLTEEQKTAEQKDEVTNKVITYLNSENDYLKAKLKHTEALQEKLYNEMVGRIKQTDESVPYKLNGYW